MTIVCGNGATSTKKGVRFSPCFSILSIMDTAFEPWEYVVPAMKRDEGTGKSDAQLFNHVIAKPRVRSEHLNGIIKSRFPGAMRKIRKVITDDKESLKEILILIEYAVILHNMLLDFGYSKDDEGVEGEWLAQFFAKNDLSDMGHG